MSTKHTPGPWAARPFRHGDCGGLHVADRIVSSERSFICRVNGSFATTGLDSFPKDVDANARLIAAAPDLLAACDLMLSSIDGSRAQVMHAAAAMRTAVRKATGETPPC